MKHKPTYIRLWLFCTMLLVFCACRAETPVSATSASTAPSPAHSDQPAPSPAPSPNEPPPPSPTAQSDLPDDWADGGVFSAHYDDAFRTLNTLTMKQKLGQLLLARCPALNALETISAYQPGGFVLFGRDFAGKTKDEVIATLSEYQGASALPMLMATDEEGGTVVRVSANRQLADSPFASPQTLTARGGLDAVRADAREKSRLLKALGVNVNLAPVADVSTDNDDFIYKRTYGQPAGPTAAYVTAVVETMNAEDMGGALKHFPGYGGNADTHTGSARDDRPYEAFAQSDFLPFAAGIQAGAGCVLVSHNTVTCLDPERPASLSAEVHRVLREELGFTGVILTDDLSMEAISDAASDVQPVVAAALAGNDLLLVSDLPGAFETLLAAVEDGILPTVTVDRAVFRVLCWKYALGLMPS